MRRVAALLAWTALLALPLRAVAACTMPAAEDSHAVEHSVPEASGHHDHGSDAPLPMEHDRCPDLASCAAAAILVQHAPPVLEPALSEDGARALVGSLESAVRSLDPPPPKG
jgi:hypothetical protein